MKDYPQILQELSALKDEKYRQFNERIVNIPAGLARASACARRFCAITASGW